MWCQNWCNDKRMTEWDEFELALYGRFGDCLMEDVVESFNSLQQEELKSHIEQLNPNFNRVILYFPLHRWPQESDKTHGKIP